MAVCPQCGQENPEGFRLCGMCGASLDQAGPSEAEERKLVSVLFVDLVGHTAASDQADPEDVRARLRPYHQLLKREIERYGGTVEKFVGDAVMAVFGAPVAHEDDAERAVRSALRILEAVSQLSLEVRSAVATGEAVVSLVARPEQGEGIVAGDVVNTASRLQNEAPPGSLVVGEATYRSTRNAIEYEQLDPVTLKGKAEPVSLWHALRVRGRFGVDAEAAPQTPFIGREHDLTLLQDAYSRAVREQAIQLVTIVGEPGVGKTRLVAEFRSWLDDQPERVRWRQGRCLPYGEGITFWALGEVVKAEAGILESDSPEQAMKKLDTAVRADVEDEADHEWLVSRLAPLVGARTVDAAAAEQSESFTAWRRFLERLAAQRPLVLLIEDLHWADSALFDFLDELVDWASAVPILILCTARPELYERNAGWGGGKRNSTTVSLSPLTMEETARLLSALLSRAVLPAETQAALLERAGGNPLYAEEFVRMLGDQGLLTEHGELAGNGEITLPETVQALISARLDTLAPDRKVLLHDASVVGKVFWPGAVASIGGSQSGAVRERLRELVRKELIRPARASSVEGEDEFSFWHALVRDVAYSQIPRASRAVKHRSAAEWIERTAGERVGDHAELLAEHYRQARELGQASGAEGDVDELRRREARFLSLAGDRARSLDLVKAVRYYQRALELVPEGSERAALLSKYAQTAWITTTGDFGEGRRLAQQAVDANRKLGDQRGTAGALAHLSRVLWMTGETQKGLATVREALGLLDERQALPELVTVYSNLAGQAMTAGRAEEALAWAEKGLPVAEKLGLTATRVRLLQFRGCAQCMLGRPDGLNTLRESLELGLDSGAAAETGLAYTNVAGFVLEAEGPEAGLALYAEGIEFDERRGLAGLAAWARGEQVWPLFSLGRWDELLALSEEYDGEGQIGVLVRTYRAYVLCLRGSLREAEAIVDELLPRARRIADAQILIPALMVAATLDQLRGAERTAVERIDELLAQSEGKSAFRAWSAFEVALVCLASRERGRLCRLLDGLEDFGLIRWDLFIESARAVALEMDGSLADAESAYAKVAREWGELACAYERAQTLFGRGRSLVGLGRRAEAAGELEQARAIFARLDARPFVAQVDAWLTQAAVG
ncbi:MAG: AAA family ATPase [Actinobacteria bacterium]|nr:AAA family ATPase [Actinomycetota bacterium]